MLPMARAPTHATNRLCGLQEKNRRAASATIASTWRQRAALAQAAAAAAARTAAPQLPQQPAVAFRTSPRAAPAVAGGEDMLAGAISIGSTPRPGEGHAVLRIVEDGEPEAVSTGAPPGSLAGQLRAHVAAEMAARRLAAAAPGGLVPPARHDRSAAAPLGASWQAGARMAGVVAREIRVLGETPMPAGVAGSTGSSPTKELVDKAVLQEMISRPVRHAQRLRLAAMAAMRG